jgi:hypothetical protein
MTEHTNTIDPTAATEPDAAEIRLSRLDDAQLAWFIAESECEQALRAWRAGEDADTTYLSYLAALRREESAAKHLERMWRASEPVAATLVQRMQDVIH